MNKLTIALAAALFATTALAQTHLDSDVPKYDFDITYQNNIKTVLHQAYADDVILRMIGEPSFSSEYVVGLKKTAQGTVIFGLRTKIQIWSWEHKEQIKQDAADCDVTNPDCAYSRNYANAMPNDIHDIGIERCETPISDAVADPIKDAWRLSLLKAGTGGDERVGVDGESFYFAMNDAGQHLGGKVWSPEAGTDPRKLVDLALDMEKLCEGKGAVTPATIAKQAAELGQKLREKR